MSAVNGVVLSDTERQLRRSLVSQLLDIPDEIRPPVADLPVYGEGPPPAPDGALSEFEWQWRRRAWALMLGIEESHG